MLQRFYDCRMEGNESVLQFMTRAQNLARQLKDVGEEITDSGIKNLERAAT